MICKHRDGISCTLGLHGGTPSLGVCCVCDRYEGCPRGLGDIVHSIATVTGAAAIVGKVTNGNCGCNERRAAMNAAFPFADSTKET